MLGDFKAAVFHGRAAVAAFDPHLHNGSASRFGHDIGVAAMAQYCISTLMQGYFTESAKARIDALALAERSQHTNTMAYAYYYADVLPAAITRDFVALSERTKRLVSFATSHALPQWVAWGSNFFTPCFLNENQPQEAIVSSSNAIAACDVLGNRAFRPLFLSFLSEAFFAAGKIQESNEIISRAITTADETGEQWCRANLYIWKADLENIQKSQYCAETTLRQALEIARTQGARLFELRVATNLAKLLSDQKQTAEARDLLAPIFDEFNDGLEIRDLKKAKAVLDGLAT